MKLYDIIKKLGLSCLLVIGAALWSHSAQAHTAMKWCTKWRSHYVDAGHGEDVFTSDSPYKRAAQYTRYKVSRTDTGQVIGSGYLDSSGCTPYLTATGGVEYKFSQGSLVYRSGVGLIYAHPDNNTWGPSAGYVYYNNYFTTLALVVDGHYTHTFEPNTLGPRTNVMPIIGKVLSKYSDLGYPTGKNTYIHTDCYPGRALATCCGDGGAYHIGGGYICMGPGDWGDGGEGGGEGSTYWKFILGHEIGHRVSSAHDGPYGFDYSIDDTNPQCNCDHVATGSQLHCMQSLENASVAEGEGFAHFFSSALFNNRSSSSGIFVYPKETWFYWPEDGWIEVPPERPFDLTQYTRWKEGVCGSYHDYRGVELDWLEFFWHAWTTADDYTRLTVPELMSVWDEADSSYWENLLAAAADLWLYTEPNKVLQFLDKGINAGVDHD
ncbi:MAG: hypothetical protein QNJ97_24650 [Myxococcota bacterium]|nr:hypothetical protein [Myxococcota bacterium]